MGNPYRLASQTFCWLYCLFSTVHKSFLLISLPLKTHLFDFNLYSYEYGLNLNLLFALMKLKFYWIYYLGYIVIAGKFVSVKIITYELLVSSNHLKPVFNSVIFKWKTNPLGQKHNREKEWHFVGGSVEWSKLYFRHVLLFICFPWCATW